LRNGNQSKGVGFVCFNTIEETTKALDEMNGKWILSKPIYVKLSQDKNNSQLATSNSPKPYIPPAVAPMPPHLNMPTMFYVPTIMVPPSSNNFPLPIAPPNPRAPPPPHLNRTFYPYIRMKTDNQ
jgi:polyadenylate-binding protein